MNTPTPRTDDVYLEHRYWANEDEATEAIEDLRDLARKLERELYAVEAILASERGDHLRELAHERKKVRVLRSELSNIANAKPATWGDERDDFLPWAQSRARHTLTATEGVS